jgi:hypothetical protein
MAILFWIAFCIIVAVAANTRGRSPPIATHYDKWRAELERKFVARGWEKLAFGMNSSVLSPLLRWA